MTMGERLYSDGDVRWLAEIRRDEYRHRFGVLGDALGVPPLSQFESAARVELDRFTEQFAGRLLPADAEIGRDDEYAYELTCNDGAMKTRAVGYGDRAREIAESVSESPKNWQEPGQPGRVLVRQSGTWVTPWRPVSSENTEEADRG